MHRVPPPITCKSIALHCHCHYAHPLPTAATIHTYAHNVSTHTHTLAAPCWHVITPAPLPCVNAQSVDPAQAGTHASVHSPIHMHTLVTCMLAHTHSFHRECPQFCTAVIAAPAGTARAERRPQGQRCASSNWQTLRLALCLTRATTG